MRVFLALLRGIVNILISLWLGLTTPLLELIRLAHKQEVDLDIGTISPDYSVPDALADDRVEERKTDDE